MSTTQPSSIGRYEIIRRLGEGGMGAVYLARDPVIERQIAVKLLREGLENEELRERFVREARSAGRLQHVNIVVIFDVGEQGGRPYIAMEYVEGSTIGEMVRRRDPIPIPQKLRLLEQLCDGLAYAHRAGIVHRDIKPANLIVSRDGVLKILDFGIARLGRAGLTMAGVMLGTLNYMSPEQITGAEVDRRSDIFAVGSVCYEFLSSTRAFPGDLQDGILHRILANNPPPLASVCPGIDPRVVEIVGKAMEKDPTRRYQDLEGLQADLAAVRESLSPSTGGGSRTFVPVAAPEPATLAPQTAGVQRTMTGREQATKFRAEQIGHWLETARGAIERGTPDEALHACQQVFALDPDNATARELADRARSAADDRQIAEYVSTAAECLARGALDDATRAVKLALALDASSPAALRTRQAIDDARRAREQEAARRRAIEAAMGDAEAAFAASSFDTALRKLDEVISLDRTDERARTLRDEVLDAIERRRVGQEREEKARATVAEAWGWYERGDVEAACAVLEGAASDHPLVANALVELRRLHEAAQQSSGDAGFDPEKTQVVQPLRLPIKEPSTAGVDPGATIVQPRPPATARTVRDADSTETVQPLRREDTASRPVTTPPRTGATTRTAVTSPGDPAPAPPGKVPPPPRPTVDAPSPVPVETVVRPAGSTRIVLVAAAVVLVAAAVAGVFFWSRAGGDAPPSETFASAAPAPSAEGGAPSDPAADAGVKEPAPAAPGTATAQPEAAASQPVATTPPATVASTGAGTGTGAAPSPGANRPTRRRPTPPEAAAPPLAQPEPAPVPITPPPPQPRGTLIVESDTPGAQVYINNQLAGPAPIRVTTLPQGQHELRATLEGEDDITRSVDIGSSGETTVFLRFQDVRLRISIPVVHKHGGGGSCEGRLSATVAGISYETPNRSDAFSLIFDEIERFQMDVPSKTLTVKRQGGRTWNFTDRNAAPDELVRFHQRVVKAREKLARQKR